MTAASATFALKAGEWFRRGRLLMVSPVHGDYRRCQAEIPLIVLSKFVEPALVVIEDGNPIGIITERHYARNVFLKGRASPTTRVRDIMEAKVLYAHLDQTVEECMAVMTEKRVRHLPVIDQGKLIGIVSIGDLVKSIISKQEFVIDQLVQFIHR
ncbi:CBS domain-containing protein [Bradyrhizobium diazoefficiens]|nr:CBS domain-containing protein [Bradyrhizobium diazoefficiens]